MGFVSHFIGTLLSDKKIKGGEFEIEVSLLASTEILSLFFGR